MSMIPLRAGLAIVLGLAGVAVGASAVSAVTPTTAPLRVAVVVPITVPNSADALLNATDLATYTLPTGVLSRQLDSVIDGPAAIGIDPRIIASIRILGTSAPASAVAWLEQLASATNEIFPLAWADADLTLPLQAGSATVPQPLSLDYAIDPALFPAEVPDEPTPSPTPSLGPEPGPEGDAGAIPLPASPPPIIPESVPTTEQLLAWDYSLTGLAWPGEDTVVSSDLAGLAASEFTTTLLSSNNVSLASSRSPLGGVDGSSVLVADASTSLALRDASRAPTAETWAAGMVSLTAVLQEKAAESPSENRVLVLTLDRGVPLSSSHLRETIDGISALGWAGTTFLSEALASTSIDADIIDQPQDPERVARVGTMLVAEAQEAQFASIVEDPLLLTAERRLELLSALSRGWFANPTGWSTAVDGFLKNSTEILSSVQIVESSTINLIADRASLPITVSNALDVPVTVYVTVRPELPLLSVEDSRVELTLAPNSQSKGLVPVQSLSNGMVEISVSLSSVTGVAIGDTTTVEINVQAGWETPVTVALAVIVFAIFGAGIVRTVLKRRKARQ